MLYKYKFMLEDVMLCKLVKLKEPNGIKLLILVGNIFVTVISFLIFIFISLIVIE